MESEEWKKDLNGIQVRLMGTNASADWKTLKERISEFMNTTRRTWGHAIFYLLEKGLEAENERNGTTPR